MKRELSGKTIEELSDKELVDIIVDTFKEQAQAVRFEVGVDYAGTESTTVMTIYDRDVKNSEDKIVGQIENIKYNTKDGYSMTVLITDSKTIREIIGDDKCQSIKLSSKMTAGKL